jgi:hypothetical protein
MQFHDIESDKMSLTEEYPDEEQESGRVYKSRRGEPREVKACIPRIRGQELRSLDKLKTMIRDEFPGIRDRDDYDSLMKGAAYHFKLLQALGERKTIKQQEVKEIAMNLGFNKSTAVDWTLRGRMPNLYTIVERGVSKSEAKTLIAKFKKQLGGLESWEDVQKQLDGKYPDREYEQTRMFELRKRRTIEFYKFVKELEKGGATSGIARRAETPERIASLFMKGHLPYLVRHVVPSLTASRTKHSLLCKVKFAIPEVRGFRIESIERLKEIINRDFPCFSDRENLPELLRVAEDHLKLFRDYHTREFVARSEILSLAAKTGYRVSTIKQWVRDGVKPVIYYMLNRSLTCEEVNKKLNSLLAKLNGVTDTRMLDRRLGNLYIAKEIRRRADYEADRKHAKKFFRFLRSFQGGGFLSDIAQGAGFTKDDVVKRLHPGVLPRLIRIASSVPTESLEQGKKWLPLRMTRGGKLKKFIRVPLKIISPQDVLDVLEQIQSLKTVEMGEYEQRFGEMPKELAFMWLLGALLSDGGFGKKVGPSTCVSLGLSRKYSWSEGFGRGFCYALGKIGISSYQGKDFVGQLENGETYVKRTWYSARTPFLMWVRKTLLGLKTSTPKDATPIQADWILQMPEHWRIAFLQGVSDGDGCASIRAYNISIGTLVNKQFLIRLLDSLEVEAKPCIRDVKITKRRAIRKAEQLTMFRHAVGRQELLTQLIVMFNLTNGKRVPQEELEYIMDLHRKGSSCGDITVMLWDEQRIARSPSTVAGIIRRIKSSQSNDRLYPLDLYG